MKALAWPLLLMFPCAHAQPIDAAPFQPARLEALITEASLDEISGIASSRRAENRYWVHDDSPRPAEVQAINNSGKRLARLRIDGVRAIDWEDIASYSLGGKPWLLIGDIGDNAGVRKDYELIAIEEPELSADDAVQTIKPTWRLRFRYPDGSHDVEAMAVDTQHRQILLINKHPPLTVYALPLGPGKANAGTLVAKKLLELTSIPQPDANERKARYPAARFGGSPTGLDIDVAGKRAIVLTYRDIWLFKRAAGETWKQAFSHTPQQIPLPPMAQAEAIGFDRNSRSILVSGERLPAPLLKLEPLSGE